MKVEILHKKNLAITLSITIDKKSIQLELDKRLKEIQSEISLKGFRPGKVPQTVIKNQFGKSIYGEVIDKILSESSRKAIDEKKIKTAGQPKIDLKTFGEGKDLNYTLEINSLPEIELKSFDVYRATDYTIKIDNKTVDKQISEIAKNNKNYTDKKDKSAKEDQVIFDYTATIDGKKFEGSDGKNVRLVIGQDLFIKGFDEKLIGVSIDENKIIEINMPNSHPNKDLANKKTKFECKILKIQKPIESLINDELAKKVGAKDLKDLRLLIEKQISSQYKQALDSITKKEILDQIEKNHKTVDLPKNLIEQEVHSMTHNLKKEEIEKNKTSNEKIAQSRIKLGLILNEYGEKNKLKVSDDEIRNEIQKQVKSMPGQEKMVLEYYQKNPNATQSIKGAIYEEKILSLFKSKIKIIKKELNTSEAEKLIADFNQSSKKSKVEDVEKDNKNKSVDKKKIKENKKLPSSSKGSKKVSKK